MQGEISFNQRFYLYFRVENNSGNLSNSPSPTIVHSMEQRYRKWSRLNGIVFFRADFPKIEEEGSGIAQSPDTLNFCQYLEAILASIIAVI